VVERGKALPSNLPPKWPMMDVPKGTAESQNELREYDTVAMNVFMK